MKRGMIKLDEQLETRRVFTSRRQDVASISILSVLVSNQLLAFLLLLDSCWRHLSRTMSSKDKDKDKEKEREKEKDSSDKMKLIFQEGDLSSPSGHLWFS